MEEENKMDLTAKLPDEMLIQIFVDLPLRDKLRLESVSRRFQRSLIDLLNTKAIPLVFDSEMLELNGYQVSPEELPGVVEVLACKAKFNRIQLKLNHSSEKLLDEILTALVSSDNGCLGKVTTFQVLSRSGVGGTGLLTVVLDKCAKLVDVRIDWGSADLKELQLALKEKELTRLDISLDGPIQQQLTQLYQSTKHNVLKKIRLGLLRMTLDANLLVRELYTGSWAALQQMDFQFEEVRVDDLSALFSSLAHLPALRKCNFVLEDIHVSMQSADEWVAALRTLFTNQIEIMVSYGRFGKDSCETVNLIRQVQIMHPDLQVDFGVATGRKPTLTLGSVCFEQHVPWIRSCNNENCADCGIFYPLVIGSLWNRADERVRGVQQEVHLDNHRLDRCRVGSVVDHLNHDRGEPFYESEEQWMALDAVISQDQNQATITFEQLLEEGIGQFQITVDCGPCLSTSCLECGINVG